MTATSPCRIAGRSLTMKLGANGMTVGLEAQNEAAKLMRQAVGFLRTAEEAGGDIYKQLADGIGLLNEEASPEALARALGLLNEEASPEAWARALEAIAEVAKKYDKEAEAYGPLKDAERLIRDILVLRCLACVHPMDREGFIAVLANAFGRKLDPNERGADASGPQKDDRPPTHRNICVEQPEHWQYPSQKEEQ